MIVLGVDPGSRVTGYGVVEHDGRQSRMVGCGCLKADPSLPLPKRLQALYEGLSVVVEQLSPDEAAVESSFFKVNPKTLITMSHARGVLLLALAHADVPVFEYAPREVKQSVVGRGSASKEQVRYMVRQLLKLEADPKPLDVTDGIAVGLCHIQRSSGGLLGANGSTRGGDAAIQKKLEGMGIPASRRAMARVRGGKRPPR